MRRRTKTLQLKLQLRWLEIKRIEYYKNVKPLVADIRKMFVTRGFVIIITM